MHNQPHRSGDAPERFAGHEFVFMMGEELKKPLTVIKALAENRQLSPAISLEARKALRTVDNVLLYRQLVSGQQSLELVPVHVGSALTDVAHDLQPLSIERGCETEVFIQSGVSPVAADADLLKSGIESMWQAVLSMAERPSPLSWHVYRVSSGIRIALTNRTLQLEKVHLSQWGRDELSRQPFAGLAGPATDLLTAQGIFESLGGTLSKVKKDNQDGFAVTLPISQQLAMF